MTDDNEKPTADDESLPESVTDDGATREVVEEVQTGYRLSISSTRGTGTRDQDEVKMVGKAETLEELEESRERMRAIVTEEMNNRRFHQPDSELWTPSERINVADRLRDAADADHTTDQFREVLAGLAAKVNPE